MNFSPNISLKIFVASLGFGLLSLLVLFYIDGYSLLYYGDAVSHLVSARQLIDSQHTPFSQIAPVWLPLPHFMMMPFSMVDSLFASGLAGTLISLPLHTLTSVFIYKLIIPYTTKKYALVGALLYSTNINLTYLGITAMTEASFLFFFVGSAYYLQRWISSIVNIRHVFYASCFIALATLCKYEAWVLAPIFIIIVVYLSIKDPRYNKKTIKAFLFSLISFVGILIWLLYHQYSYDNLLWFVDTEFYSASSQALERPYRDFLYLQPLNVLGIYFSALHMMVGFVMLGFATVGGYIYLSYKEKPKSLVVFLALPASFTLFMMLFGIAEMSQYWFNARFSSFIIPLVIVLATFGVYVITKKINRKPFIFALVSSLFIFQIFVIPLGIVVFDDAYLGYSYKHSSFGRDLSEFLMDNYDEGKIMIITGSAQAHRVMITSQVDLLHYDMVLGSSPYKESFHLQHEHYKWIIIGSDPGLDSKDAANYYLENMDLIEHHYSVEYDNLYYTLYKIKK